jgi:colanic acid biosynthesis glycosyl transferase WcaI
LVQKILVHDYSGHPFQPQLSRRLALRGHAVVHAYSQSVLIPQGALSRSRADASTLEFRGLALSSPIDKEAYVQRYFQERVYGKLLARMIRETKPDVVISSSTPLDAQGAAFSAAKSVGAKFVFWLQDIQAIAIEKLLGAKLNGAGRLVGRYYTAMEKSLLRRSDAVVSISEDFSGTLSQWGVDAQKVHVVPNWASMEELPQRAKDNPWSRAHGLIDKFVFLYSGTIGLKHNPGLLLWLAEAHRAHPEVRVVVVSEGAKTDWLKREQVARNLSNMVVLPFQPYAQVPDVMGAADVLVAVLEPDAGMFSVPSKVLAYHCAGRPVLLAVPESNLAARIVKQASSGLVADPLDVEAFVRMSEVLRANAEKRALLAENALHYARQTFNLERITDRFESLFESLLDVEAEEEFADERA